jgi:hypothetical protein
MWRWMRARSARPRGPPKRPHTIQKAGGRADLPNLPEAPQRHGTRRPTPDRTAAPRSHLVRDGVRQSRAATLTVREQARNQRSTPAKSKRCSYRERETCGATAAASGRGASRAAQVTSWAEAREPSRLRRRRVAVQGHLAGQRQYNIMMYDRMWSTPQSIFANTADRDPRRACGACTRPQRNSHHTDTRLLSTTHLSTCSVRMTNQRMGGLLGS